MESIKVSKNIILELQKKLFSDKNCNILSIKNESELFRLECSGRLIVGYKTGSIAYQMGIEEYLLKKVEEVEKVGAQGGNNFLSLNIKVKPDLLSPIKKIFKESNIPEIGPGSSNEYARFELDGCKIVFYKNGTLYSQKNHDVFKDLIKSFLKTIYDKEKIIIGQDEVGKGEYYGPIIVASVCLNYEQILDLQLIGVKDSKELTNTQIENLSEYIKTLNPERHFVQINPKRFNELYQDFKNEGKTLNNLLAWGHAKVLEETINKIKGDVNLRNVIVIIDEFDRIKTEEAINKKIKDLNIEIIQKTKADAEYISVSAASIIAKKIQLQLVNELENKLNKTFTNENWFEWLREDEKFEYIKISYLENRLKEIQTKPPKYKDKNYDEVINIIKQKEGLTIDFKLKMPPQIHDVAKWFTAFANAEGGKIYFGISDKDHLIIGIEAPMKIEERLIGVARNNCEPPIDIKIRYLNFIPGISVLEVSIPKVKHLTKVKSSGKYYKRIGSICEEMSSFEIEEHVRERQKEK